MPISRRGFLITLHAAVAMGNTAVGKLLGKRKVAGVKQGYTIDEIDQKLGREGKPTGLCKDDLPTPALVLDLDLFEANLKTMAQHAASTGKSLRPHAKTHKCAQIARRQAEAGAIGISVATVPEAQVMVAAGVRGVHLTSPLGSPDKVERMVRLAAQAPDLMVALDHPRQVEMYDAAAASAGCTVNVLVDLNVGDRRTGVAPGQTGLQLAQKVDGCKNLRLRGLQAYSGGSSHVVGFAARTRHSHEALGKAIETRHLLLRGGLRAEILSTSSTGTYNIDSQLDEVTELQVGSYIFMDVDYRRIGGRGGELYDDFAPSLAVLATVVSTNQPDRVSIDAGIKRFATDRDFVPEPRDLSGATYRFGGDEFGILEFDKPSRQIKLGDRLELIVPHCDPTVNLYDRIYACRRDRVEEVWGVMDRLPRA